MKAMNLEQGMVVQLSPKHVRNPVFAACFMIVTDPKSWGAQGYIQMTGTDGEPGGQAYYRATWDEMDAIGIAVWIADRGVKS
jgi:hypothetical protein